MKYQLRYKVNQDKPEFRTFISDCGDNVITLAFHTNGGDFAMHLSHDNAAAMASEILAKIESKERQMELNQ